MRATIIKAPLPASVRGFCAWDKQGCRYIIMVNATMTQDQQRATLKHELQHIKNNDFAKPTGSDVNRIETEARQTPAPIANKKIKQRRCGG